MSGERGRPKINHELMRAQERLARLNAGLLACYETIDIGNQKKRAVEEQIRRLKAGASHD